jgi:hypothetical protein
MHTRYAHLLRPAALAAALALAPAAQASLPPGMSGAWYNPAQSGHGLSVEVIAPNRALIFWYLYDTEGQPFFLYLDGRIEGRRIEATALAPTGLRFGSFDRSDFAMPEWGAVTIEFDDCNNGVLHWDANSDEFGSGSTQLKRLTRIHASDCSLKSEPLALQGRVDVGVWRQGEGDYRRPGIGAIDPSGRLWAIYAQGATASDLTSPTNNSVSDKSCVGTGSLEYAGTGELRARMRELTNSWTMTRFYDWQRCGDNEWQGLVGADSTQVDIPSPQAPEELFWRLEPASDAQMVAPLSVAQLAGDYETKLAWQFGTVAAGLSVGATGTVCLDKQVNLALPAETCALTGQIWLSDPQAGFFDFELTDTTRPEAEPYRGRGWLENRSSDGQRIVLIGHNEERGWGVVGR